MENNYENMFNQIEFMSKILNNSENASADFYEVFLKYLKMQSIFNVINEKFEVKRAEHKNLMYMLSDAMPYIDNTLTKKFRTMIKLSELKGIIDDNYENPEILNDLDKQIGVLRSMLPYLSDKNQKLIFSYIKVIQLQNIIRGD